MKDLPRITWDGIELVHGNPARAHTARIYLERAASALQLAASAASGVYAQMKLDVQRIILWKCDTGMPYHSFQRAIIVPPQVAEESDLNCLAAWLLHVSEWSEQGTPGRRSTEFLKSLPSKEAKRVSEWLAETARRAEIARESFSLDDPDQVCPL